MRYKIKLLCVLLFLLSYVCPVFALTGEEAMTRLMSRLNSADTIKGRLTISYQTGEVYSGIFMYMRPGKMYVKFTDPPGKLIITNGKKLWTYDASTEVCGIQELETTEADKDKENSENHGKDVKPRLMGGISRFFRTYEAKFIEDPSQPAIELVNEGRKYSEVKFVLTKDFIPVNAVFKDINSDGFVIKFFDVKTGEKIAPGVFNFKAPANAQVVKNPLDIR
ncbi:MAG: outer-membrane lipoprotein carrier protein LolA [Spirochaetota bacterium]